MWIIIHALIPKRPRWELGPQGMSLHFNLLDIVLASLPSPTSMMIDFSSRRPPIMLTKATRQGGEDFWTILPEERDKKAQEAALLEAGVIGGLITENYQNAKSDRITQYLKISY